MIPNDWQTCTVEDCCEILDSRRIPLNQDQRRERKGDIPYWGANGILDYVDDYLFDEPLILMAEDGGYFEDAKNRPICNLIDGQSWVNNHAHVLRTKSGVLREWVYFWFVHRDITHYINGGTRSKLNQSDLRKLPLALPKFSEQKKIAAILSSVDDAIHATQAVIDQTHRIKQGLMQQLLTRGIGHTQFKQTEIGEIPKMWIYGEVGDFLKLQRGFDITQKQAIPGEIPVISSSGISYHHNQSMIEPPGVITGRKGKLGKVYFVDMPCWPHDTSLFVKDFKGNDPRFIFWVLIGLKLEKLDAATAVPTLNRNTVHKIKIAIPPIDEQKNIVKILDSISDTIMNQKKEMDALNVLKRGLMQDLLTGRVRVGGSI